MRYAIAIWNYMEPGRDLAELVEEFAGMGFTAVSFAPVHLLRLAEGELARLREVMEAHDLLATTHGAFEPELDVRRLLEALGPALRNVTFDAPMRADSRGRFYDGQAITPLLRRIEHDGAGTELRFGVEDFPLDPAALDYYREDLKPLLACPRYGMLLDVGHLNIRLRSEPYFQSLSVAEYLAAAPLPVWEVHLHDNAGLKDSHGHFGMGNVDFAAVADGLKAIDFAGISTIEIAPRFHNSTPAQSKPLAKASLEQWRTLWEGA